MPHRWFNPPVYVKTERPGLRLGVNRVDAAAGGAPKSGPIVAPSGGWRPKLAYLRWMAKCRVNDFRLLFEAAADEEEMLLPD
ncbi:DUF982 domain-containing protein [Mesorhizobium sp. M0219]|uniref:DUF982 domain-containing protein n=1 Tax=Mesorhizobium sp. M0219 TaxID=2956919 RepID=UPI00333934F1